MASGPDVSVIICTYTEKRWDDLLQAIASVRSQWHRAHQIVVVVDHNRALFARVRAAFPEAAVVENQEARGLSGARNSGVAVANGAVLAFLDEDAEAAPDWLTYLIQGYDDPAVMGVGGLIEPNWLAGRPRWFPEEFDWVVGCCYRGMPTTPQSVRNLIGCNMSFRRELLAEVGGFRTGIGRIGTHPVGGEETEFCIRAHQYQPHRRFLYEPRARVRHKVPAHRGGWDYFRSRCRAEGESKALITDLVGSQAGLAAERQYTRQTLPAGVRRGLWTATLRRDGYALLRASAIIMGLGYTAWGYGSAKVKIWLERSMRVNQADNRTEYATPTRVVTK